MGVNGLAANGSMKRDEVGEHYWPIGRTLRLYPWGGKYADLVSTLDSAGGYYGLVKENINIADPATWADWMVLWLAGVKR